MPCRSSASSNGFTHARILAERVLLREIALADVDRDALVADLRDLRDLEARVALEAGNVGRRGPLDEVELARLQVGEPDGAVDDRQIDDAVDVDLALVPVVRIALDDDAVLRNALDEAERSRADGIGAELFAGCLRCLRRDHHSGAIGELREERRERCRKVDAHGHRIDDVDARHGGELAAPVGAGHRLVPLEVVLDGGGIELLAVVERHVRPDLHRQRLVVRRPLVGRRELRDDGELLVDVEELVAQRREHDAPDERAGECRIEHVRILGESEAERRLGVGGRGEERHQAEEKRGPGHRWVIRMSGCLLRRGRVRRHERDGRQQKCGGSIAQAAG
jgi:hypothetical protein